MEANKKIEILGIFLVLFISACVAGSANFTGCPIQLEMEQTTKLNAEWPDIYGDIVTFSMQKDGNYRIYTYKIPSGNYEDIGKGDASSVPRIWGDKIVWTTRPGNISMYDLTRRELTQITNYSIANTRPDIYDNYIVWDEDGKLVIYDMNSEKTEKTNVDDFVYPKIYKNIVVSIYGKIYDLDKGKVVDEIPEVSFPHIYENIIIFEKGTDEFLTFGTHNVRSSSLYMYDLDSKKVTQITSTQDFSVTSIAIWKNKIVFIAFNKEGGVGMYLYDIPTNNTKQVFEFKDPIVPQNPQMYENNVVWFGAIKIGKEPYTPHRIFACNLDLIK